MRVQTLNPLHFWVQNDWIRQILFIGTKFEQGLSISFIFYLDIDNSIYHKNLI